MSSAEHELIDILEAKVEYLEAQVKELKRSNEAYCWESLRHKGEKYKAQRENQEMKHELLWIIEEVWPLVHGLTSRQTLKARFLRLNDFMGKLNNGIS